MSRNYRGLMAERLAERAEVAEHDAPAPAPSARRPRPMLNSGRRDPLVPTMAPEPGPLVSPVILAVVGIIALAALALIIVPRPAPMGAPAAAPTAQAAPAAAPWPPAAPALDEPTAAAAPTAAPAPTEGPLPTIESIAAPPPPPAAPAAPAYAPAPAPAPPVAERAPSDLVPIVAPTMSNMEALGCPGGYCGGKP